MAEEIAVLETPVAAVETPAAVAAPDTPAVAAPETPATPESREQALRDAVGKSVEEFNKPKEPAAAEAVKPAEAKPVVAAPVQTPEEKAAADKAIADKAAADAKAAETKEVNPLDKLGLLPAETLAKAITDHPELAQALEKAGIDSEVLFETSRQAALTGQFQEIFPTPEAAKFAGESAQHFYDIEENFPKIQDVKSFDEFLTKTMLPLSVLYDEQGKPLMTADGKGYQTDGSIERFLTSAVQFDTIGAMQAADRLIAEASRMPGEDGENMRAEAERVKEALTIVQNFRDSGGKLGSRATTELPPDVKAEMDRLRAQNADAEKTKTEGTMAAAQAFETSITTEFGSAGTSFVESTLNRSSLNDNEKGFIAEKTIDQTLKAMAENRDYQRLKQHYYDLGQSPDNKQRIVALANSTFKNIATKIMGQLVEKAGGKMVSGQQAKFQKIDVQIKKDTHNQGGGTTASSGAPPVLTSAQMRAKAIENFKAANRGEMPDDGQILQETLKIRGF